MPVNHGLSLVVLGWVATSADTASESVWRGKTIRVGERATGTLTGAWFHALPSGCAPSGPVRGEAEEVADLRVVLHDRVQID